MDFPPKKQLILTASWYCTGCFPPRPDWIPAVSNLLLFIAAMFIKGSRFGHGAEKDKWIVSRKLGEGQFAEVYEVKDYHNRGIEMKVQLS